MSNFNNGKIYEIVCNITGKRYVGSTVQTLGQRLSHHKSTTKCSSREIISAGDYSINLLAAYPCGSRSELLYQERVWYDKLECVNLKPPYVYIEEHIEHQKQLNLKQKESRKQKKLEIP